MKPLDEQGLNNRVRNCGSCIPKFENSPSGIVFRNSSGGLPSISNRSESTHFSPPITCHPA